MAWIGVVFEALLAIFKSIFGMDQPATTEVINAKPDKPLDNDPNHDDDLLRELGVQRREPGTASPDRVRDPARGQADAGTGEHHN